MSICAKTKSQSLSAESERYDEKESEIRFEAALKAALKTPHKPLKPAKAPTKKSKPEKETKR